MNFFAFSALINGITSALLGIYVLANSYKNPLNRSYSVFALSVFIWSFGYFFWQNSSSAENALLWSRILMAGAIMIPLSYFDFSLHLTGTVLQNRLQSIISCIIGMFFLLADLTPLIVSGISKKMYFDFWPTPGLLYPFFLLMFFFYTFYSLSIMLTKFKKSFGQVRPQIMYVFWGTAIGFAGGSTNFLLWYDIPIPPLANILVLAYPVFMAISITKHRLMDLSVIISRTAAEILAILFQGIIYLSMVWLYQNYVSNQIDSLFITLTVIYGIWVGQTHQVLRLKIQTTTDKAILRGKYDYYKELSLASIKVGEDLSLSSILKVLYATFYETVQINNPRIFLPNNFTTPMDSKKYVVYSRENFTPIKDGEEISMEEKLIEELTKKRGHLLNEKDHDRNLIVPCLLENRLIAMFILGPKLSQDPYTDEDIQLLEVLASQVAIALDHTRSYEKIKDDLEATQMQLERSQRLASLGTLTAGVTHEIRNPLTVIRLETLKLPSKPRDVDDLKQRSDLIVKYVDRIELIVEKMLHLSRFKAPVKTKVDLNSVVEETFPFFSTSSAKITKELQPVPKIDGDPEELERVLINLIQNAEYAKAKKITIKTFVEKNKIHLEVSDNGKGIPKENISKIFDPFFSSRHEGTGLGLSIAYRIIREHGGTITVDSEEDKGTTFKIEFEAAAGK
ncbi:hypothetical protein A2276_02440 [candidate division WOR-1 bacterium RIFOXYA12_FULL_43_27]|uniref:histidine kinase n=1 Tax=candidate division WOR-1 bacterium RIFOXYC2_FULL_46_14 TaxID=1802587 RepID=A0A1F4U801_UNCSA|nr:MAG: hypothetical protein A2276_02440 [candidate division WOR-1 bacterium RIFOXYA12_FULL_43_27]OGC19430.1 MAG: hypothetical protein A2292_01890 [candidate division WOR-1 bacterium RIFOXYB2_FULL_46_45]OGC30419.1 MAG: hypothetical protein A2232_01890 [candidate division WOR-1 bacterium RIFOXYA2_FULL_46_56]OGC41019.1 MAG: hypothetical protein A2438_01890 [candidate division WOR-1 bacterium RIFOXYC2_FULL_46_14]